jgi:heme exporter protein D
MWAVLAGGFFYMAFDEAFSVHDKYWGPFSRSLFSGVDFGGYFEFAWVAVGIPLVAVLGLLFLPFLRSLPGIVRRRFVLSATVFLFGAIVIEMLSANWSATVGTVVGYKLIAGAEEAFEMAGIIMFIWAAMHHLADRHGSILFDFSSTDPPAR